MQHVDGLAIYVKNNVFAMSVEDILVFFLYITIFFFFLSLFFIFFS